MVLLRMLPVTFRGVEKDWLMALPPGAITTWAQLREEFTQNLVHHPRLQNRRKI